MSRAADFFWPVGFAAVAVLVLGLVATAFGLVMTAIYTLPLPLAHWVGGGAAAVSDFLRSITLPSIHVPSEGVSSVGSAATGFSLILGLILIFAFYFLPSIVGASRHKSNAGAIFVLNLLLGWSLIGWVVALVWALTAEPTPSVVYVNNNAPPTPPNPERQA